MNAEKSTKTNEKPNKPQRDAQGRFVKGNDGGAGNPFGRHLGRARCKWNSLATPDHVENVYKAVYEKAIDGCVAAMKLYLLYLLGKPNPMPNPDHVDLEEYALYIKATQMLKQNPDVMLSPDHRYVVEVARTARLAMAEEARKNMLQTFQEKEEEEREIDEQIKAMEDEYDRQQAERGARGDGRGARETLRHSSAEKRSAAAKRGKKPAAMKQRRVRAKRKSGGVAHKPAGSQIACVSRSGPNLRARNAKPFDLPNVVPEDPREPHRKEQPSPSNNGFFPQTPPLPNGFLPEWDPEASDG